MTTLVTGANGLVGSHVVRLLVQEGREVRALVRPSADLRSLEGVCCEWVVGDVLDGSSLRRALAGCRRVYHVAAVNRLTAGDGETIRRTALEGTRNVLRAAADAGVERAVYTSSVVTVGRTSDPLRLLTEEDSTERTLTPYVQGKVEAEAWVQEFFQKTGFPVVIVNPCLVLGPGDYRPTPGGKLVRDFVVGRPALVIPAGFNVVDVRDVAQGHLLAEGKGRPGQRYLLGGANLTLAEFYRRLAALLGRWRLRLHLPRPLAWTVGAAAELLCRPLGKSPPVSRSLVAEYFGRYSYCDTGKAERELGYRARPLEETLRASVRWFLEEFSANPRRPVDPFRE